MAPKVPTGNDLLAEFDSLVDSKPTMETAAASKTSIPSRPAKSTTKPKGPAPGAQAGAEVDPLADLEGLAKSRPLTPANGARKSTEISRSGLGEPPTGLTSQGEKTAPVNEKNTSAGAMGVQGETQAKVVPEPPAAEAPQTKGHVTRESVSVSELVQENMGGGGGGWWGGLMGAASAAVKQAEALAKDIQQNEEAQKWAEQMRGNVGALRNYGQDLRTRALPTFTDILHTLAPPISSHERLQVHVSHDLTGYPSFDPLVHQVFARVMSQVEGGDLLIIQRGREAGPKAPSHSASGSNNPLQKLASGVRREGGSGAGGSTAGWSDGPWWRDLTSRRDIGSVTGLVEGTKLARASAEGYATESLDASGGVENARKLATEQLNSENPTRLSDIFLAIQAIVMPKATGEEELFSGKGKMRDADGGEEQEGADDADGEDIVFAIYLHDPIHALAFSTVTQSLPARWVGWLEAEPKSAAEGPNVASLPEDIATIIQSRGVDPREWVAEWLEECLTLGVGVVAQRYVARRMGVGEKRGIAGGDVEGARREKAVEAGAGELARAM